MNNKGLWINEKTFVSFTEKKNSLTEEIATRKVAIDFYSLGLYLPNPDPVLKKQGKDIAVYKELLTDSHVGGCITSRKAGVKALEWSIDRGKAKSRQAKLIEDVFKDLDIDSITSEILNAPLFGYQVLEVIWQKVGNYILPKKIIGKPHRWFVFGEDNTLRLRTKDNTYGKPVPERKFLLVQHEADYENPYGFPALSRCFWPVTFKKGGLKFWVLFTEKYGMPFLIGKQPRGTGQQETERFADQLESMVQDAIAVIPDDSSVEILKSESRASSDIYNTLITYCDTQISITLLGQNLTTQVASGSYAATSSHMQVRKDVTDSDKKLCEKTFNKLIHWIFELNFDDSEPPVFTMWEQEDVDKDLAERDEKVTISLEKSGLKLTKKYYQKNYGFEDEDIEEINSSAEFAEGNRTLKKIDTFEDQHILDDAIDSITPEELQAQMEGVLKPVINLINESKDYNKVMEKLVETYQDMDTKALENMLIRAIFISELWGKLNAHK